MSKLLEIKQIVKHFKVRNNVVKAVVGISLSLERGESCAVIGPSGSGKSTVLHMAGLIMAPDSGEVWVNGKRADDLPDGKRCAVRNSCLGYVVQDFALLEEESVYRNIGLPLQYNRSIVRKSHRERIERAARSLDIADKLKRPVNKLSGGERQRVAIARALVCDQPILLADEPTGSLDIANTEMVMDLLMGLVRENGKGLLVVTHDPSVAERCDRIVVLKDGKVAET